MPIGNIHQNIQIPLTLMHLIIIQRGLYERELVTSNNTSGKSLEARIWNV